MKILTILILVIAQISYAQDACVDIAALSRMKTVSTKSNSELKEIIEFYNDQIRPKILVKLENEMIAANINLDQAPFKIKWKFDRNGGISANCDCEDIINTSKDIKEARAVFKILNAALPGINRMKTQLTLSKSAQKLEYCATGKFQTTHSQTESKSSNTSNSVQ
jgi:hypothetical protein